MLCKIHRSTLCLSGLLFLSVFQFPHLHKGDDNKIHHEVFRTGLAHKILPLEGKILIRMFKALKINYNPIFEKHLNSINHTVSEKDTIVFAPNFVLSTYKIHTKDLCDRNYPPHFINRKHLSFLLRIIQVILSLCNIYAFNFHSTPVRK